LGSSKDVSAPVLDEDFLTMLSVSYNDLSPDSSRLGSDTETEGSETLSINDLTALTECVAASQDEDSDCPQSSDVDI
jgi:hypothetical protein